jgi:hypothetical protein
VKKKSRRPKTTKQRHVSTAQGNKGNYDRWSLGGAFQLLSPERMKTALCFLEVV